MNPFFVSKLWNLEKVFVSKAVFSRLHKFKIRDKIRDLLIAYMLHMMAEAGKSDMVSKFYTKIKDRIRITLYFY